MVRPGHCRRVEHEAYDARVSQQQDAWVGSPTLPIVSLDAVRRPTLPKIRPIPAVLVVTRRPRRIALADYTSVPRYQHCCPVVRFDSQLLVDRFRRIRWRLDFCDEHRDDLHERVVRGQPSFSRIRMRNMPSDIHEHEPPGGGLEAVDSERHSLSSRGCPETQDFASIGRFNDCCRYGEVPLGLCHDFR